MPFWMEIIGKMLPLSGNTVRIITENSWNIFQKMLKRRYLLQWIFVLTCPCFFLLLGRWVKEKCARSRTKGPGSRRRA